MKAEKYYDYNLKRYNLLNRLDPMTAEQVIEIMESFRKQSQSEEVTELKWQLNDMHVKNSKIQKEKEELLSIIKYVKLYGFENLSEALKESYEKLTTK